MRRSICKSGRTSASTATNARLRRRARRTRSARCRRRRRTFISRAVSRPRVQPCRPRTRRRRKPRWGRRTMRPRNVVIIAALLLLPALAGGAAEMRFPPPDFQTSYKLPDIYSPPSVSSNGMWDAIILFLALSATTWMVFRARSRKGLFLLSIFSLAYFGFYRTGCICPVGSTQNVMAAVFLPDVGVSVAVLSFFVMPLLFSLFFGRVFCASVCPLGAMQELVAIAPIRISPALDRTLGLGRYVYLGLAVLGVA
ncbi:MAG: 4Fe-4S binding protein, partial [Candidatus Hydrogenedentes bacterium]|nr:4Fe-4S binding protein [Candidatus Hydrogenedentota bacterium]